MNEMRKLMEAVELDEDAGTEATAYVIYDETDGYYRSPGYYTGNLALAKTYARSSAAEKQRAAQSPWLDNAQIWEIRITEVKQIS